MSRPVQKVTAAALGATYISLINHEDECLGVVLLGWFNHFLLTFSLGFWWWITGSSEVKVQLISPGLGSPVSVMLVSAGRDEWVVRATGWQFSPFSAWSCLDKSQALAVSSCT